MARTADELWPSARVRRCSGYELIRAVRSEVRDTRAPLAELIGQSLDVVGLGWMQVEADAKSAVTNLKLGVECDVHVQRAH